MAKNEKSLREFLSRFRGGRGEFVKGIYEILGENGIIEKSYLNVLYGRRVFLLANECLLEFFLPPDESSKEKAMFYRLEGLLYQALRAAVMENAYAWNLSKFFDEDHFGLSILDYSKAMYLGLSRLKRDFPQYFKETNVFGIFSLEEEVKGRVIRAFQPFFTFVLANAEKTWLPYVGFLEKSIKEVGYIPRTPYEIAKVFDIKMKEAEPIYEFFRKMELLGERNKKKIEKAWTRIGSFLNQMVTETTQLYGLPKGWKLYVARISALDKEFRFQVYKTALLNSEKGYMEPEKARELIILITPTVEALEHILEKIEIGLEKANGNVERAEILTEWKRMLNAKYKGLSKV